MNVEPMEDADLRGRARKLGAEAANRLDPNATAQAVLRRLRAQPSPARRARWQPLWLSAAAAVVLMAGAGILVRSVRPPRVPAAASTVGVPTGVDLSTLSADQLREVLEAVEQPLELDPGAAVEPGLEDLSPRELRTLLQALEG